MSSSSSLVVQHKNKKKKKKKRQLTTTIETDDTNNNNNHDDNDNNEIIIKENSISVSGNKPLPPIPIENENDNIKDKGSILLFYQYVEPMWNKKEHSTILKDFLLICNKHNITGRGRIAQEGINCTLTSKTPYDIRNFINELRNNDNYKYSKLFQQTDFKITDNISHNKIFKSLSIRKTNELVAYGLNGNERAPSLKKFSGIHLNAYDYHNAMKDKNTVIIDVRNYYESTIGNFQPPKNGATLLDPKLRNSIEFPKWLSSPSIQSKLHNKKVLMYCTGGIRCERATALLNQITTTTSSNSNSSTSKSTSTNGNSGSGFQTNGVYELQGGIERYIKTFPNGGYWKGKNYLFDKRMEQIPSNKTEEEINNEILETKSEAAKCVVCFKRYTSYHGKYKCSKGLCGVPVIVCPNKNCINEAKNYPQNLQCELCRIGYRPPKLCPDLINLKRKAEEKIQQHAEKDNEQHQQSSSSSSSTTTSSNKNKKQKVIYDEKEEEDKKTTSSSTTNNNNTKKNKKNKNNNKTNIIKNRIFLSKLPLTVTKTKIKHFITNDILGTKRNDNGNDENNDVVKLIYWLRDKKSNAFYGSCIVELYENNNDSNHNIVDTIMAKCNNNNNSNKVLLKIDKKKIKISYCYYSSSSNNNDNDDDNNDVWPPKDYIDREFPPIC